MQLPEKQMNQSYARVNAPYAYAHAHIRCSECNSQQKLANIGPVKISISAWPI